MEPRHQYDFHSRYAAAPASYEDDLLAAVADIDGYDSGTSFSQFDTRGDLPQRGRGEPWGAPYTDFLQAGGVLGWDDGARFSTT